MRKLALSLLLACAAGVVISSQEPSVVYTYDELGRLVGVVDPSGEAATYSYDPVGNLLAITRHAAGAVAIFDFTPNASAIGTSVTIRGIGFSAIPSQNTVTFNGAAAAVTGASTTLLVATVPVGATTGPIAVTAPAGAATSNESFVVSGSSGPPAITAVTPPIAAGGSSVTVTGTNFDLTPANDNLSFNYNLRASIGSASSTNLLTTVTTGTTSGRLHLTTPLGSATADLFVPPSSFTVADVQVTGRFAPTETKAVSVTTSGKVALFVLEGGPGKRVSLDITGSTLPSYYNVYAPSGTQVSSEYRGGSTGFIDVKDASVPGSYSLLVDPSGTSTGSN